MINCLLLLLAIKAYSFPQHTIKHQAHILLEVTSASQKTANALYTDNHVAQIEAITHLLGRYQLSPIIAKPEKEEEDDAGHSKANVKCYVAIEYFIVPVLNSAIHTNYKATLIVSSIPFSFSIGLYKTLQVFRI